MATLQKFKIQKEEVVLSFEDDILRLQVPYTKIGDVMRRDLYKISTDNYVQGEDDIYFFKREQKNILNDILEYYNFNYYDATKELSIDTYYDGAIIQGKLDNVKSFLFNYNPVYVVDVIHSADKHYYLNLYRGMGSSGWYLSFPKAVEFFDEVSQLKILLIASSHFRFKYAEQQSKLLDVPNPPGTRPFKFLGREAVPNVSYFAEEKAPPRFQDEDTKSLEPTSVLKSYIELFRSFNSFGVDQLYLQGPANKFKDEDTEILAKLGSSDFSWKNKTNSFFFHPSQEDQIRSVLRKHKIPYYWNSGELTIESYDESKMAIYGSLIDVDELLPQFSFNVEEHPRDRSMEMVLLMSNVEADKFMDTLEAEEIPFHFLE
jgi:hypothetical protein